MKIIICRALARARHSYETRHFQGKGREGKGANRIKTHASSNKESHCSCSKDPLSTGCRENQQDVPCLVTLRRNYMSEPASSALTGKLMMMIINMRNVRLTTGVAAERDPCRSIKQQNLNEAKRASRCDICRSRSPWLIIAMLRTKPHVNKVCSKSSPVQSSLVITARRLGFCFCCVAG